LHREGEPQMRIKTLWLCALATLLGTTLRAQDIAGDWQGTLKDGAQELRIVLQIAKRDNGGWKATMYSIDQTSDAMPINSIALEGADLKLTVDAVQGTYAGKVSTDGNSIAGTWTQSAPLPLTLRRTTKETAWPLDPAAHTVQFITVDNDVKLEVLDWGGSGRPLVLLTGLGNDAHVYDKFAPKLIASYHVYGITRRGFGASSAPATGYSADRLGDDVLNVIDALKLTRPILAGHSIGGEELSSIGSRHPEKVAGLVYLEAAYPYAWYDPTVHVIDLTMRIDLAELQAKLGQLSQVRADTSTLMRELISTALPRFEADLREWQKDLETMPPAFAALLSSPLPPAQLAIWAGGQKYTKISPPILAIFAVPPDFGALLGDSPRAVRAAFEAKEGANVEAQVKSFETGNPAARVVRLPHADHYVFQSNEDDVIREMKTFIGNLP